MFFAQLTMFHFKKVLMLFANSTFFTLLSRFKYSVTRSLLPVCLHVSIQHHISIL